MAKERAPAERMNAKLRQLACLRREGYLLEIAEEQMRVELQRKMWQIIGDLMVIDKDDPEVLFAKGQVELEKPDYMASFSSFSKCKKAYEERNAKIPEYLDRLVAGVSVQPSVVDVRPAAGKKFLGVKPVIILSLKALTSAGPLKVKMMQLNKKPVQPMIQGTQILYMPTDNELPDGDQEVEVEVVDALGVVVKIPPFNFALDKRPPDCGVLPEHAAGNPPTVIEPKAKWHVKLFDAGGLRLESINISLKDEKKKNAVSRVLVVNGQIKGPIPPVWVKEDGEFDITSGTDLAVSEYTLTINAMDTAGNELKVDKKYSVKGTIKQEK
jgi:hypothetical protein